LLIDKGFIQSTILEEGSGVTESRNVTGNCNMPEMKTSKNGINHAQNSDIFAASNLYAPWSGGEQCEPSSCRKEFGVSSNQTWQAASNRERKPANEKYCY
jgi:hypothetical protein